MFALLFIGGCFLVCSAGIVLMVALALMAFAIHPLLGWAVLGGDVFIIGAIAILLSFFFEWLNK